MSLQGTTIDAADNVASPVGTEVIPVGDGSGDPLNVSINQILFLGLGGATVTDNTLVRYDGTTGKRAQKTSIAVDDSNNMSGAGDITITTAKAIKTDTTNAHTMLMQVYDVDGAAYVTFLTATNANTPTVVLAAPSGGTLTINGAAFGASTFGNTITVGSNNLATTVTCTHAAGASNSIDVTITVKDGAGSTVAACHRLEVFITEDVNGALGLTTDTFSGALTASTGKILSVLTSTKHVVCTTDVNGVLVLNLVDSAKPADQYFCVSPPMLGGRLIVSAASAAHWGA